MDFIDEMTRISEALRARGFCALTPIEEEQKIDYAGLSDTELAPIKNTFIVSHLEKIRGSDAILIVNLPKRDTTGYIGANTLMEAAFALALGKRIFVLHEVGEQPCRPEILGMLPKFLDSSLENLTF